MDQALLAFFGVVIGGLITTITTWLTNRQAADRERDQWERQHRAEAEARQSQEQAEAQARLRARIEEIYDKALFYAPTSVIRSIEGTSERTKWWNLLMVYYYAKESAKYKDLQSKVTNGTLTAADIVDIAAQDPRLQIDYKPPSH